MGIYGVATCHCQLELELELIQPHKAQKPMLRGEVGARVRVVRACDQRRERMSGRVRPTSIIVR